MFDSFNVCKKKNNFKNNIKTKRKNVSLKHFPIYKYMYVRIYYNIFGNITVLIMIDDSAYFTTKHFGDR